MDQLTLEELQLFKTNLPESLQGVISDDIISGGAMGAGAGQDVAWDTALKYGDPIQRSAFQDDLAIIILHNQNRQWELIGVILWTHKDDNNFLVWLLWNNIQQ